MLFSSLAFLCFFLPLAFVTHWVTPGIKSKNYVLLTFSLLFYACGEPIFVLNMLFTITITYFSAILIERACDQKSKLLLLTLSVIIILSLLFYFKYFNFIVNNLNHFFYKIRTDFIINLHHIAMPLGISFYSFQAISYLIDVYREEIPSQKNYSYLALSITLFPHLIAGPIVRYKDIHSDIVYRKFNIKNIYYGITRFIEGLAKKVLIANTLGGVADKIFATGFELDFTAAWCGAICYSMQLYFDFSGYSDMAIGLAKMFGFNFKENFNYPYTAQSITDFWRRWHISLSSWFRDYVYIPLGGNKVTSNVRLVSNIFIVFALTGIWHGANWTFLIWGIWHSLFVILEKLFSSTFARIPRIIAHIYSMLIIIVGWVIFRCDSISQVQKFIRCLFTFKLTENMNMDLFLNESQTLTLLIGLLISIGGFKNFNEFAFTNDYGNLKIIGVNIMYLLLLTIIFIFLIANSFNPFIYFRF